eukprot:495992-Amphidinium_carterae.1
MRVDLLEAVPFQVHTILLYIMKALLPSTEHSRIGIAKDVMKQPRNGIPRDMTQSIAWLEDFFNLDSGNDGEGHA